MRIVLITQHDPFYLGANINYLINKLPKHSSIVACVLFDVSPFGKKESMLQKVKKTISIFGLSFFFYYSIKYALSKVRRKKNIKFILTQAGIPIINLEKSINNDESLSIIRSFAPDLLISVAGNQIFKRKLIDLAPKGCLNLHTALLPKYRGLMPSFWVLKNDEAFTGVSVFFVDEGIDSGPILLQKKVTIGAFTQEKLIQYTKRLGMDAIIESIELIVLNNYTLMENKAEEMTYYSFPTQEDVKEFLARGKKFF